MKQKILLIIALFAIVAGARAQTLYRSNVVVEKNELLESNVTIWKRLAKLDLKKEQLDARLRDLAQHPTTIKDIEYYETGTTIRRAPTKMAIRYGNHTITSFIIRKR